MLRGEGTLNMSLWVTSSISSSVLPSDHSATPMLKLGSKSSMVSSVIPFPQISPDPSTTSSGRDGSARIIMRNSSPPYRTTASDPRVELFSRVQFRQRRAHGIVRPIGTAGFGHSDLHTKYRRAHDSPPGTMACRNLTALATTFTAITLSLRER